MLVACVVIFALLSFVQAVFLMSIGVTSFVSSDTIKSLTLIDYPQIVREKDTLYEVAEALDDVDKNTSLLGGISVGTAVIILIAFFISCVVLEYTSAVCV